MADDWLYAGVGDCDAYGRLFWRALQLSAHVFNSVAVCSVVCTWLRFILEYLVVDFLSHFERNGGRIHFTLYDDADLSVYS